MELAGLTVLVTRPAGRADELLAAIAAAGGRGRHAPLLAVAALDAQRDAAALAHTEACVVALARYQRVIAISTNAVHYGLIFIRRHWHLAAAAATADGAGSQRAAPPVPVPPHWYGIGAATAAALAQQGIAAVAAGAGMTSEALLALPEFRAPAGERVLILRGVGGRETLAATLRARGAEVDYAECYRRERPPLDAAAVAALWQPPADAVCVNSAETLANLWHYLPEPARQLYRARPLLVPSARVAEQAHALGFARVLTAADAGTAATVAALKTLA